MGTGSPIPVCMFLPASVPGGKEYVSCILLEQTAHGTLAKGGGDQV